MRRMMIASITVVMCLLLTACSSTFKIKTDFDTEYNFSELKTYIWDVDANQIDSLSMQRFRTAIEAVLLEKGIELASNPETASLTLRLRIGTEDRKEIRPTPAMGHWGGDNDVYWHAYQLELFIVEFIQVEKNRVVWESKASARIINDLTPPERDERANKASRVLLQTFPPAYTQH